jgi:putative ABC transport system permease protein
LDQLLKFLNLAGFTALLLGGVGVAAGIHAHLRRKLVEVAVLRCLGARVSQAFAVYFAQAAALGAVGSAGGVVLGIAAQFGLQAGLADFLPARVPVEISPGVVGLGLAAGFVICLFFALLPLLPLRRVPPLAALRSQAGGGVSAVRDPLVWLLYAVAGGALVAFGVSQTGDWRTGAGYAGGVAAALGVLAGFAWVLSRSVRALVPASWPFVLRQGFGNLHRPDNRTVLLMQSLGIGVFLVLTMVLLQASLSGGFKPLQNAGGNAVLFDIQPDQRDGVLEILREQGLPVIEDAPMISMRLHSVKGLDVEVLRRLPGRGGRMVGREYRSTYREALSATETLVAGEWVARVESLDAPVPISMEVDLARRLQVGLGDPLVFDVQGILVNCVVGSLREVDWRRLSPNFFVVFPAGAIEAAPAVHAMVTRVGDDAASARMQRAVVGQFPNVSAVDLTLVLRTIDGIFSKISEVVRFMALFTVGTGLLVLAGTIASGRQQRVRESILLRTLGATRGQIRGLLAVEYVVLGVLAALNGIVLANLAAWAAGRWVFKTPYEWRPVPALIALGVVALVTLAAGLLGNRRVLNRPPLEVLREEN